MAEKQLIIAVEGTAAMGPYWSSIVTDYLEKIIRCFCGAEAGSQKPSGANVEFGLVMFNSHGSYSACLVQRSGWTRDIDLFLHWLTSLHFGGGGFNDAAIAEGLAEALMMLSSPNGNQTKQTVEGQKHCILVAASNPYPLPTPVYRPQIHNSEQSENETQTDDRRLSDAETVAKSFAQCSVSLSVVCPKLVLKLKTIYAAAKRNPRGADLPIDNPKNPYYLVLISENFMEARAAFNRTGMPSLPSTQNPVKMDVSSVPPISGPLPSSLASIPSANGPVMNRQPIPTGNVHPATVKIEPTTVTSMPGPTFTHVPAVPRATSQQPVQNLQTSSPISVSQEMIANNENLQETKPMVVHGMGQSVRPVGAAAANVRILNDVAQARQALAGGTSIGLSSMGGTPMLSNMISSGMASSVSAAQSVISSSQPGVTSMTSSMPLAGPGQVVQSSAPTSFTATASSMSSTSNLVMSQSMNTLPSSVSVGQSVPGMNQANIPGTQMMQTATSRSQNMMSGMGATGMPSGTGTMVPTPGMTQQGQQGMQAIGVNSNSAANMPLSQQQTSSQLQSSQQSKYVKVWEGNLSGQRQGQPVFITRLEGYRSATASETLAANWPETMQIVRLISQDHMNNKQYVGKADFLVFRAMNQHGFLGQLQEKKLCAVIQLPSQTLLLSVSDKACRLIGMLFPGPQMVGTGMNQAYMQGPGRSQLMSQGQVSSQGLQNMPGGGFMN
nr:mediator of RNA polymerase II transcription subunit 25-like [Ipomoea batatas]